MYDKLLLAAQHSYYTDSQKLRNLCINKIKVWLLNATHICRFVLE